MRRAPAILALTAIFYPWIAPVAIADESTLPACCRRSGAHHCSMPSGEDPAPPSDGSAIRAAACCPAFPLLSTVSGVNAVALVKSSHAIMADLVSHPSSQSQNEAILRAPFSRSHQKRGPPVFLSI